MRTFVYFGFALVLMTLISVAGMIAARVLQPYDQTVALQDSCSFKKWNYEHGSRYLSATFICGAEEVDVRDWEVLSNRLAGQDTPVSCEVYVGRWLAKPDTTCSLAKQ